MSYSKVRAMTRVATPDNGSDDAGSVSAETFLQVVPEDWEAKRADAMTLMAEHCLKNLSNNAKSGGRFEILMHVNANPEHSDYRISDGPCCYLHGGYVPGTGEPIDYDLALAVLWDEGGRPL